MMKRSRALLTALLLSSVALAQSVDEIIAKHVAARGGIERLHAMRTLRYSGAITLPNGGVAQLSREIVRPDRVRTDFVLNGVDAVRAFDGKTGWHLLPFTPGAKPEPMSGHELQEAKDDADLEGPLVDYKAKGNKVELLGNDTFEGKPCYRLRVTTNTGRSIDYYLDKQSFLETGLRTVGGEGPPVEAVLSDYRDVSGMKFSFKREVRVEGKPQVYTLDKLEVNAPIDEARFKMPTAVAPAPATGQPPVSPAKP